MTLEQRNRCPRFYSDLVKFVQELQVRPNHPPSQGRPLLLGSFQDDTADADSRLRQAAAYCFVQSVCGQHLDWWRKYKTVLSYH